ncbi:MAG: ABC transporter permease [Rikenellaceae bacterium]|nr:ABC transporter permease [Rikenellaceae bacterium]
MRTLKLALRNVVGGSRGQLWKILFLGTGLAAGLMLLTKVWYEQSYEDFYPDSDRIYQLASVWGDPENRDDEDTYYRTPGGYAPLIWDNLPQVELGTRFIHFGYGAHQVFYVGPERQRLRGLGIMADEYFYDVMPRPMLSGDAKEILTRPMQVMVSEKIAKSIDGDPVGQTMVFDNYPGKALTIAGVFEDVPKNTRNRYDFVMSLESITAFEGDGRNGLMGNDRYTSFLKMRPGTDMEEFQSQVDRLVASQEVVKELEDDGWHFGLNVTPLRDVHKKDAATKRTSLVLMILAASILFATVFNYLLVVLSDTMARGKGIAVMKSYGAGFREIASSVMAETTVQMVILLITSFLLVLLCKDTARQLLGNPVEDLLTWQSGLLLLGVVLFIILLSSYVQARVYNNIAVASVFRSYRGTGRMLKLGLLFVQVTAAAFLAVLLLTVIRQYNTMINDDPGYDYDRLVVTSLQGVDKSRKLAIASEIGALDVVEAVSLGSILPLEGASGNNILHPDTGQELFNIADLEEADENYLPLLGVEVIEGRPFRRGESVSGDVMVSRSFVEKITDFMDWPDGVIGKDLNITQYGRITITGVYEDFKIGNSVFRDHRPSVLLYTEAEAEYMLIKMRQLGTEPISRVNGVLTDMLPDKEITVSVYADMLVNLYRDHLNFRRSITIASVIVMIIVLVGLIGYMRDETARRQKEIAVRKINGATVRDILTILGTGILKMMGPAMLAGIVVSYFVAQKWTQAFSVKASFSVPLALLCAVVLAVVALTAVSLSALRVARRNPAETIKTE